MHGNPLPSIGACKAWLKDGRETSNNHVSWCNFHVVVPSDSMFILPNRRIVKMACLLLYAAERMRSRKSELCPRFCGERAKIAGPRRYVLSSLALRLQEQTKDNWL